MSTLYGPDDPSVWMVALKDHTYDGKAIREGDVYLAHPAYVETLGILGFSKQDTPPPTAEMAPDAAPAGSEPAPINRTRRQRR